MILYLHGFRSGPQSTKCRLLREYMAERGLEHDYWCEQLQWGPSAAIAQVAQVIETCSERPTLVGSSLGGYYATFLAERYGLRAILVNPSVVSHITLEPFLGTQTMFYNDEPFEFTRAHIDELRAIAVQHLTALERYWLLVETGEEVLDYRQAVTKYQGARQTVLEGGDHSFTRWSDYLNEVLEFAGIRTE